MIKNILRYLFIACCFLSTMDAISQQQFSRLDSLRGSITPEREWWDLNYYHLDIEVMPEEKFISGSLNVQYTVLQEGQKMQIDLQEPLSITRITQKGKELSYTRFGPVYYIDLKKKQKIGKVESVVIEYEGYPTEAVRAPWDGGFSWDEDQNGNPFIATSNQGIGASIWWPCKDHMYDEVDSMLISVEVPENLTDVSNGRLRGIDVNPEKKTRTFHWFVSNPINNYGVNVNIGDYVHWQEVYAGENGNLDMDFWVLSYNEEKAREQFKQAAMTIEAFEYWFGPYPFYKDGYKLVEVPYLGMEHQSSVTYGNKYKNGYLGQDRGKSGWGLKFDYIIIHESGHEWFANNITYKDIADMWIHESFTCYSESLYLEYWFGKQAGEEYNRALRPGVYNQRPMIGYYNVNHNGADLYNKGAQLLMMIRQLINDDEKWRKILRGMGEEFYHQTVTTEQIETYIIDESGIDLSSVFDLYLRTTDMPILDYYFNDGMLYYRWLNVIEGFDMPVDILLEDETLRLYPTPKWNKMACKSETLIVQPNYYIAAFNEQHATEDKTSQDTP